MTIEPVTTATLDDAVELLVAQLDEHGIAIARDRLHAAADAIVRAPSRGALLIAREDGRAVAIAALTYTWTLEHGGAVAWLEELYVVPDRRGAGIGAELLERALATAEASGCHAVDLEVTEEHQRAENLYRRHGFEPLHRRRWARRLPVKY